MNEIISKVIPILLLISLGYFIRTKNMLKDQSIDDIKKLIINISLPSILFITFLNMEFKVEYLLVFVIVFLMLAMLYFIGILLNKINLITHPLLPFVITGCTFGLLGISLYETVFGAENLEKISILGVGHELFMWIFFFNAIKMRFNNERFSIETIKNIFRSPLVLSIVFGLAFNILGFGQAFLENTFLKGIYTVLQYLGNIATPFILIIVGFGLKFNKKYMKQSAILVSIRYIAMFIVGYTLKFLLIDRIIPNDRLFDYGFFTFLILPPPYSLTIFVGQYATDENKELINNTLVLSTVVCITAYISFVALIGF